jgi:endogenous inhibitor of DNA gyrase (YacG/DUF329 family)
LIDLGAWLTEQHKIPDESPQASDDSCAGTPEES